MNVVLHLPSRRASHVEKSG